LPSIALALGGFASFMRFTRASMLDTLGADYVRTAKAKGLPPTQVILRHAFRTGLLPVMTLIAISIGGLIDGAIITEQVFGWNAGMGTLFIRGLNDVDPYPIMGTLVVTSLLIVFMNAVADIMYAAWQSSSALFSWPSSVRPCGISHTMRRALWRTGGSRPST